MRVLASFLPAVALGSVLWQSYWLAFFYGSHSFLWFLGSRAAQFAVTSLVNAALVYGLFKSRVFDTLPHWDKNIITSHKDFERIYGKKADRRRKLSNGGMTCTLHRYFAEEGFIRKDSKPF